MKTREILLISIAVMCWLILFCLWCTIIIPIVYWILTGGNFREDLFYNQDYKDTLLDKLAYKYQDKYL